VPVRFVFTASENVFAPEKAPPETPIDCTPEVGDGGTKSEAGQ
jgi:hypothetical protein